MKKIIDGKMYNTDTAKKLAEWSSDLPVNDNSYYSEALYRKRTGEYFLHGEGGPSSKYAKTYAGDWIAGETIIPLSLAQAKDTVNEHLDAEDYEKIFGIVSEGGALGDLHVQIDSSLLVQLKQIASESHESMRELVEEIIKLYLKQK